MAEAQSERHYFFMSLFSIFFILEMRQKSHFYVEFHLAENNYLNICELVDFYNSYFSVKD